MVTEQSLFSATLVSPKVQESLPEGLKLRPLQRSDFKYGHLDVLRDLAHVGDITEAEWTERFDWMTSAGGSYFVLVIVDDTQNGKIIGTGTLIIEKKL